MFYERLDQLNAISWAMSTVSAIVRPCAINPWRSSLVAGHHCSVMLIASNQFSPHFECKLASGEWVSFRDMHGTAEARFLQHGHYLAEQHRQSVHRDTSRCKPSQLCTMSRAIFQSRASSSSIMIAWFSAGFGFLLSIPERARK